jgi:hypothetical protein
MWLSPVHWFSTNWQALPNGAGVRLLTRGRPTPRAQIARLRETALVDLASKLQLKDGQRVEAVLAPGSVAAALIGSLAEGEDNEDSPGLLVFVADSSTLEERRTQIVEAAASDRLTWVSYPKSGQLGTDLHRDSFAALLSTGRIQPVRQIALNDVWSALRFRPA